MTMMQTILLVDGDEEVRDTIGEYLRDVGHTVLEAENGEQAVATIEQDRAEQRIRSVIADIFLPCMNGLQFADATAVLRPDLKIIMISGSWADDLPPITRWPYLRKPFRMHDLLTEIELD